MPLRPRRVRTGLRVRSRGRARIRLDRQGGSRNRDRNGREGEPNWGNLCGDRGRRSHTDRGHRSGFKRSPVYGLGLRRHQRDRRGQTGGRGTTSLGTRKRNTRRKKNMEEQTSINSRKLCKWVLRPLQSPFADWIHVLHPCVCHARSGSRRRGEGGRHPPGTRRPQRPAGTSGQNVQTRRSDSSTPTWRWT